MKNVKNHWGSLWWVVKSNARIVVLGAMAFVWQQTGKLTGDSDVLRALAVFQSFQAATAKWYALAAAFRMFDRLGVPRAFQ